ncbi:lysozyme [Haematobacter sp. UBA3484]|uniref:lysozyme n=1 Tax=Haematobacter sp. UBA3484 TaxID=1946582 RepID=UPI0025BABFC2|nr:lysozyme [Haematobacter sp. UBA3484]
MVLAASFISGWEGRELRAYRDIVGVWTICQGLTEGVRPGDVATVEECDTRFAAELRKFHDGISACYPGIPALPDKVQVAYLSLAYNIGIAGFCGSTARRRAEAGDLPNACHAMTWWNKVTNSRGQKVVSQGLMNRRKAEEALCLEGAR